MLPFFFNDVRFLRNGRYIFDMMSVSLMVTGPHRNPRKSGSINSRLTGARMLALIEFVSRVGDALHLADEMGQHEESAGGKNDDTDDNIESRAA